MSDIQKNLQQIKSTLPRSVELVAISKFHPVENILQAYQCGQRIFGESREQEIKVKQSILPKDIKWHFIGHLQTNKVKNILPYIDLIESVDSTKLLYEIEKQAQRIEKTIHCLLEINISNEPQKYGFNIEACHDFFRSKQWATFRYVQIDGVMGIASNTNDKEQIRKEFRSLKEHFSSLKKTCFSSNNNFRHISMGMSNDYPEAIAEGSTMIRIGTAIFGERK